MQINTKRTIRVFVSLSERRLSRFGSFEFSATFVRRLVPEKLLVVTVVVEFIENVVAHASVIVRMRSGVRL